MHRCSVTQSSRTHLATKKAAVLAQGQTDARYISHTASFLMPASYLLIIGIRMGTLIYHLPFEGGTVRAKHWLIRIWFIWLSHIFQHCCCDIPDFLLKFFKWIIAFLDQLAHSTCVFLCNDVSAFFDTVLLTSTEICSRLSGSAPLHLQMGMCQNALFPPSPLFSIYPALRLVKNYDTWVMYTYLFKCLSVNIYIIIYIFHYILHIIYVYFAMYALN